VSEQPVRRRAHPTSLVDPWTVTFGGRPVWRGFDQEGGDTAEMGEWPVIW